MQHHCDHIYNLEKRSLRWAIFTAAIFMIAEVVGGAIANSLALVSDALHMFTDVGAMGLSLFVLKIARKPRTKKMTYGFGRAEALGALGSGLTLWALSGVLIYEAVLRFFHPEMVRATIVFVIASIGLLANLLMMWVLKPHAETNLNIKAATLHVLGDLLGSIGVILSGVLIYFTKWYPLDPIITLIIVAIILFTSGRMIQETVMILMESAPSSIDSAQLEKALLSLDGVEEIHDLHIWSLTSTRSALSVHLVSSEREKCLTAAHALIESQFGIQHMTIQVEDPQLFSQKYCYDCEKN